MKIRAHPEAVAFVAFSGIRAVCSTLKWEIEDEAGILTDPPDHPLIWAFWHNRIFAMPYLYRKWLPERRGRVLTSPSYDGEIIAATLRSFRVGAVRVSSNKRALASFRECLRCLRRGEELVVTPDGPRGPRYKIQPGLAKLSQATQIPVFPIRVEYSKYKELGTWDRFRIPLPFSRVKVTLGSPYQVPREVEDLQREREKLEGLLA